VLNPLLISFLLQLLSARFSREHGTLTLVRVVELYVRFEDHRPFVDLPCLYPLPFPVFPIPSLNISTPTSTPTRHSTKWT
jgi:hypothetical protein